MNKLNFIFEWLILSHTGRTWGLPTTICLHQMAAVGFEPMTLGFWGLAPAHCAIDVDNTFNITLFCCDIQTNGTDQTGSSPVVIQFIVQLYNVLIVLIYKFVINIIILYMDCSCGWYWLSDPLSVQFILIRVHILYVISCLCSISLTSNKWP